jgi:hypothetical protein
MHGEYDREDSSVCWERLKMILEQIEDGRSNGSFLRQQQIEDGSLLRRRKNGGSGFANVRPTKDTLLRIKLFQSNESSHFQFHYLE